MELGFLETLPIPANFWNRGKHFLTNTELGLYLRFITALCATAGYIPYNALTIRKLIGCTRNSTVSGLLDKMFTFCECELITLAKVPQEILPLLHVNADYNGKILRHEEISALALELLKNRQNDEQTEKEKKRSKRKEKEETIKAKHTQEYGDYEGDLLELPDNGTAELQNDGTAELQNDEKEKAETLDAALHCVPAAKGDFGGELRLTNDELQLTNDEKRFSFAEFRDLWNTWAEHFGVAKFQKLTDKMRGDFKRRQEAFKAQGAFTQQFWIELLSAVAETSGGFYIGKNDGYRHCGTKWLISPQWLLKNDEHIDRFLNAVA